MNQLTQGTVTVSNGSTTVTGVGTQFTQATAGESFFVAAGDNVVYTVASIASNTSLTLSSPFQGTSASGIGYIIHVEIIDGLPLFTPADADTALLMNEVVKRVAELSAVAAGLGTAATADVTTSSTDTTAGRLLKVGDFGQVGSLGAPDLTLGEDLDLFHPSGTYNVRGNTLNGPGVTGVVIINNRGFSAGAKISQIVIAHSSSNQPIMFLRTATGSPSVWSHWQELYHTGNLGESDTAWTTVTSLDNGWTGTVRYIKRGGMVTVVCESVNSTAATSDLIIQLPSNYRPSVAVRSVFSDADTTSCRSLVGPDGFLVVVGGVGGAIRGSITFPVLP